MEKLLTIQQLAELIQYSPKTIYQWVHVGFIPHYKFPKGIRFRISEVDIWVKKRRKSGRKSYVLSLTE